MTSLKRIWSDKRLTLDTKLRTYQTRVLSVLLYAADTWTLLSADVRTGCFPTEVSETAAWNAMVRPSPKWWSTSADRSDFTVPSPIPSTHLGIWACGSTWRRHTGKHGSSAAHQPITQPTSWPHVASPTWSSTEQLARKEMHHSLACAWCFAYLKQHLLPAIKRMLSDTFTFQQDSSLADRATNSPRQIPSHQITGHQTARKP